jgi:PKD repeat protein
VCCMELRGIGAWSLLAAGLALAALGLAPEAEAQGVVGGPDRYPPTCSTDGECAYRWKTNFAPATTADPGCAAGGKQCPDMGWVELAPTCTGFPCATTGGSGTLVPGTNTDVGGPANGLADEQFSSNCLALGFSFKYYGTSYSCAWVHSNGFLVPDNGGAVPAVTSPWNPQVMPSATAPNRVIAGVWADLHPGFCGDSYTQAPPRPSSGVWYKSTTTPTGMRVFIVEWNGIYVWDAAAPAGGCTRYDHPAGGGCAGNSCGRATFAVKLYENGNVDVVVRNLQMRPGNSGTPNPFRMGIEDNTGAIGLTAYNDPGTATTGTTLGNYGVRYYPNHMPKMGAGPYPGDGSCLEDSGPTGCTISFKIDDPDGDPAAAYDITGLPTGGSISPTSGVNPFTYVPLADFYGLDPLSVRVTDDVRTPVGSGAAQPHLKAGSEVVSIEVTGINDIPNFRLAGVGASGTIGAATSLPAYAVDVRSGPATPSPNEDHVQRLKFQPKAGYDESLFSVQPQLLRDPSQVTGNQAVLVFTGAKAGTTEVCWEAVDDGGTANGGKDTFPEAPATACGPISVTAGQAVVCDGEPGLPHAAFFVSSDVVYAGRAVTFTDDSSAQPAGNSIISWEWDFGDKHTSSQQSPVHAYKNPGFYTVTLKAKDRGCAVDVTTRTITVRFPPGTAGLEGGEQGPVPYAGPDVAAAGGEMVRLRGVNKGADSSLVQYAWRQLAGPDVLGGVERGLPELAFRAPEVAPGASLSLRFGLRLSDGRATSAEDIVFVNVTAASGRPLADAGPDRTAARGTQVILDATGSSDPDGDPLRFRWVQTAGPRVELAGSESATPSFTMPQDAATALEFRLNATDGYYLAADTVRIFPVTPTAAPDGISLLQGTRGRTVQVAANILGQNHTWDFGDGTAPGRGAKAVHTYAKPGNYTVKLTLQDMTGQTQSFTRTLEVQASDASAPKGAPAQSSPAPAFALLGLALLGLAAWRRR